MGLYQNVTIFFNLKCYKKTNILLDRYYSSLFLAYALPILKFAVHFTFTILDYSLSQHISSVIMVAELPINYLTEISAL